MVDNYPFTSSGKISVNQLTQPRLQQLIAHADVLRLGVSRLENGCTIVDAGIQCQGSIEAGRLIAEICMGGLGQVSVQTSATFSHWPGSVSVRSFNPVLACLASQYAGWSLSHDKFFALASGPARALARREELFTDLNYQDEAHTTCLVLESNKIPPQEIIAKVARDTGVTAENITFILTPTSSLAGTTQIVARVLEVALHKIHALHFPLSDVVDGMASAPLPPPSPDFLTGMGRTNDAILLGGQAHIFVKGSDASAEALAQALPSCASKDYGRPFAEVFKSFHMDFYQIDPMLFSPAKVTVSNIDTGRSFFAGHLDEALLNQSFGFVV